MRMWDIPPGLLCNQHLLGEHLEMHMFVGSIQKGISIAGYITKGLVNPNKISKRHDLLAAEMIKRGMRHESPLDFNSTTLPTYFINQRKNKEELKRRCFHCSEKINK